MALPLIPYFFPLAHQANLNPVVEKNRIEHTRDIRQDHHSPSRFPHKDFFGHSSVDMLLRYRTIKPEVFAALMTRLTMRIPRQHENAAR
jgi:hypothetical protein